MKKKGTIGIVATLGLGLCAYALSQQPQVKEEKKNQIQYLQADKKSSSSASSKKEDSIEAVNAKEKTQAEQIAVSYTHLDVYKRQVYGLLNEPVGTENLWISDQKMGVDGGAVFGGVLHGLLLDDPVSYTHRDVYKRQV